MVKKALLLLSSTVCLLNAVYAQKSGCITDEVNNKLRLEHPEIAAAEARLKAGIKNSLSQLDLSKFAKTTDFTNNFVTYHVPIVFHIVHDYGVLEYIPDNDVYRVVNEINEMYNRLSPDTADVIGTFAGNIPGTDVRYIGKTRIQFHLATVDPEGNPTHGITRRRSYLSVSASDQAKFDIWPPQSYMNIWVVRKFSAAQGQAAAYAYKPATADVIPFYDGVISFMGQPLNYDNTLAHELGHSLNLDHPWGATNDPNIACGDDAVDDTPPTKGHVTSSGCSPAALYDTACTYTKTQVGKINMNFANETANYQNGLGINFRTLINQVFIDSLKFYPTDSGAPYQIVLKKNNTILSTYNGVTKDNKNTINFARTYLNTANALPDNLTGVGIKFLTYDTMVIKSLNFFSSVPAQPYQIVLKHLNNVIGSYNGVTSASGNDTALVNFALPVIDSTSGYSIEFAQNPGAKRDSNTINGTPISYVNSIQNFIKVTSDVTTGRYNYFYNWKIQLFNYKQNAPVQFFLPLMDTAAIGNYKIEMAQNPGAKRELAAGLIYPTSVSDVLDFASDSTDSRYNYFYDWNVRYGYYKRYDSATAVRLFGDHTKRYIDYPDTTNAQNVMDYTYCSRMFTSQQGIRMRETLENTVANRNNLITAANLTLTGALAPRPDLPPIADFTLLNDNRLSFICQTQTAEFANRSWNDTVSKLDWTFSNGAQTPAATQTSNISYSTIVSNKFTTPGWVTVSLTASSNAGTNTVTKSNVLYIADPNTIQTAGYVQEFNAGGDLDMYPTFNYYNNGPKWEVVNNAGYFDNTSMRYSGFDQRTGTETLYGTPVGDFDDFYTRGFDLSTFGTSGTCNLNFMSAGAFKTNMSSEMRDTLEISYNVNCNDNANNWTVLKRMGKAELGNNGTVATEFLPNNLQWQSNSFNIPGAARGTKVYFRFRFKPNVGATSMGSGNNFYIDRINFNNYPTGVNPLELEKKEFVLAPNPTTGSTSVIIKNASGAAQVQVTDVTGKVIYRSDSNLNGGISRIDIPASYIAVKGVYLVQVVTGSTKHTEKLVVY